jgi:hypothetical protein
MRVRSTDLLVRKMRLRCGGPFAVIAGVVEIGDAEFHGAAHHRLGLLQVGQVETPAGQPHDADLLTGLAENALGNVGGDTFGRPAGLRRGDSGEGSAHKDSPAHGTTSCPARRPG